MSRSYLTFVGRLSIKLPDYGHTHWVKKSNRTRNGADLPCALDDSGWSVLPNDVSHASESFRKNHDHCDNPRDFSVIIFPVLLFCILSLTSGAFITNGEFSESFNQYAITKPPLPCWLACSTISILNFAALFLRPAYLKRHLWEVCKTNFCQQKKVKKTPVEPEGCRKEAEISWTPQGREAHQIKAET